MTRRFGLLAAFAFSGLFWWWAFSLLPAGGSSWRDRPPARFQGNATAGVVFTDQRQIQRMCSQVSGAIGCTVGGTIYVPNPCTWGDAYATLMCHELGHVRGWTQAHER